MGGEEHVVRLDGSPDEQASQGYDGQAEASGETLFGKGLYFVSAADMDVEGLMSDDLRLSSSPWLGRPETSHISRALCC